eukprot:PhF_6_TR25462/c1_g1_i1/m.35285
MDVFPSPDDAIQSYYVYSNNSYSSRFTRTTRRYYGCTRCLYVGGFSCISLHQQPMRLHHTNRTVVLDDHHYCFLFLQAVPSRSCVGISVECDVHPDICVPNTSKSSIQIEMW